MVYTYPTVPPDIFHKWSAISTVAGALQRRVWVQYDTFQMFPNMYNVLIGPPGTMKSTAMRIGQKFMLELPGFNSSMDSISREKLIMEIQQSIKNGHSSLTAYSSEFSSFFSTSGPEMAAFLTDIYESPEVWSHKTKTQTSMRIENACLNLQACTTPEALAKSLPIHVVGLGLTSRITFVHASLPRDRDWRGNRSPEQAKVRELLSNDLQVISTLSGEYNFTPEADDVYNRWFRPFQQNLANATEDDRLRPYFSRKHAHVIKLCMVLTAMRRDEPIITLDELNDAWALLNEVEAEMGQAFVGFGGAVTASPMARITDILYYRKDWMAHGALLDLLKRDVRRIEFEECLETLIAVNTIEETVKNGKKYYRCTEAFQRRLDDDDRGHESVDSGDAEGAGS